MSAIGAIIAYMKAHQIFILLLSVLPLFLNAQQNNQPTYPKIAGYVGILHPIATFSSSGTETNFTNYYTAGMPVGINIWKSSKIGFSTEFVPTIRVENGTSKMVNFTFHPGILLSLGKGWTFAGRAAFETSGRYGLTPVLNKVVVKGKSSSLFAALPIPIRFGNSRSASLAIGFQFGLAF